ncbi:MAG: hypothetical protein NZ805_15485 [Armatimonadetes bacterium]|nr:hypothetical protein [Armatimonadota bacterium]MDW8028403.1 hypothetical protein [Armatimonadota bacterium]
MKKWVMLMMALGFTAPTFSQQIPGDVVFSGEHFFAYECLLADFHLKNEHPFCKVV